MANHRASKYLHPFGSGPAVTRESLLYVYHVSPSKAFGTKFQNHTSITTARLQTFVDLGASWAQLPDGGSRDSVLKRYLATARDSTVVVDGKSYLVPKGAITLVEHLPDETYRVSIPLRGQMGDDAVGETVDTVIRC